MIPEESREQRSGRLARTTMAFAVVGTAIVGTVVLAVAVVLADGTDALTVFNVLVPVVASWVGTVLAFYFGRENFESANREIREMVRELTPDERARQPAVTVMHPAWHMTVLILDGPEALTTRTIGDLKSRFVGNVSRLPILRADHSAWYMVHESRLNQYLTAGGELTDTLQTFLDARDAEDPPVRFDYGYGFLTVAETASIADVKRELDSMPTVQDVFVTRGGTPDGEVLGWISNVRLARYLPL